ncbi:nucleotidyltransferase [Providencia rettgeri]
MSIQSYLTNLSSTLVLKDNSIVTSINTLQRRLNLHFPSYEVDSHFIFGSNSRYTMLPRKYDHKSDVDYMVVFSDLIYTPQTYLNKLRGFVNRYYSSSEISQSFPTIKLNLNHITFELVPATRSIFFSYQIPSPENNYNSWMMTDPHDIKEKLTNKNTINNSQIKPLIRILKYWNARAGYPYESFSLEKSIINMNFYHCNNIKEYLYSAVEQLSSPNFLITWKTAEVNKLKSNILTIKFLENTDPNHSENLIKKIFPII